MLGIERVGGIVPERQLTLKEKIQVLVEYQT
jgi:hypothetical protein